MDATEPMTSSIVHPDRRWSVSVFSYSHRRSLHVPRTGGRRRPPLDTAGRTDAGRPVRAPTRPGPGTSRNRRNDPANRAAFHAQGSYFRAYEDAGFVADPTELLQEWQRIEQAGLEPVAAFHIHRRQPANFSSIDFRLHNPAFAWHLIISLRDPTAPEVRPFQVRKEFGDLGIDEYDDLEGSEQSYLGPEVTPLRLVLTGHHHPSIGRGPAGQPNSLNKTLTEAKERGL
jgi:proteasome lid subunit RPN8/RPN11